MQQQQNTLQTHTLTKLAQPMTNLNNQPNAPIIYITPSPFLLLLSSLSPFLFLLTRIPFTFYWLLTGQL